MKEKSNYTEAFRQQAVAKVYNRGGRTVNAVAEELNVNPWTLRNWMKSHKKPLTTREAGQAKRPKDWSLAERLQILMESYGLSEEARNGFCREKGLFPHHLEQWRREFEHGSDNSARADKSDIRALKEAKQALERELKRKEKALAEAAALLVLEKKYQALWEEKDG